MSRATPDFRTRQYLLHVKIHAFNQAVTALGIPHDQLLRVTIDAELDLSVDTPRGTLHTLNPQAMIAEIVSLDTGKTTDVRVVTSPSAYRHLQASRTAPDPGAVSLTLPEYVTLTGELSAQQRHLRRGLRGAALSVSGGCLILSALLAWAFQDHALLIAPLILALLGLAGWTLLTYRARPQRLLQVAQTLRLSGPVWTPGSHATRQVQALLTQPAPDVPTP